MAALTIQEMVMHSLPFLVAGGPTTAAITLSTIKQEYYLQGWTLKTDLEVEDEANYSMMQKMLISELVCMDLLGIKTLETVGGTAGEAGSAGKRIKKAVADVVEAEFDYGKSSDGTFLGKTAAELGMDHARLACEYAAVLKYSLPFCMQFGFCAPFDVPPFIAFDNETLGCTCG